MHELWLTAAIASADLKAALKILQGQCAMLPLYGFERIIIFEGPQANPLSGLDSKSLKDRKPQNIPQWKELQSQITRQSYFITLAYEVEPTQFGQHSDIEEARGTLCFQDWPDPPGRKVDSRMIITIRDEAKLPELLRTIGYRYSTEQARETYSFYRENVTFTISRDLTWPQLQQGDVDSGRIRTNLPPLSDFVPFDGENKWLLKASVEVSNEKEGALMKTGVDELLKVQRDLQGVFEFFQTPRKELDTRVPAYLMSLRVN